MVTCDKLILLVLDADSSIQHSYDASRWMLNTFFNVKNCLIKMYVLNMYCLFYFILFILFKCFI